MSRTRSPLRGIHLPSKLASPYDYEALGIIHPGSVVTFSTTWDGFDPIGQMPHDPALAEWLRRRPEIEQIVRLWPVKGPENPADVAARILRLHEADPHLTLFQIANEPDIEWGGATWASIAEWALAVWWNIDFYRSRGRGMEITLLFPPFAQWSAMDPENVGYDACRSVIEHYLDRGDGIVGHEYWDRGNLYLVEDNWPAWLRDRLPHVPFYVGECGRRPIPENGIADYALTDELVAFSQRTRAKAVIPFLLSSPGGPGETFDCHDFVDKNGTLRAHAYGWGWQGP